MKTSQKKWTKQAGWTDKSPSLGSTAQLVLVFGGTEPLQDKKLYNEVTAEYPNATVIWCSTAGEILDTQVEDGSLSLTAIEFEKTTIKHTEGSITDATQSFAIGKQLAERLDTNELRHVLVFSDGLTVNGTDLVGGITAALPEQVTVTGGLVGDGADFKRTILGVNTMPTDGKIILVGLYGSALKIGYGSLGGWDTFGPKRTITKSTNNVLYEIDGRPALELYKEYLGEQAKNLPGSALLFPLNVQLPDSNEEVVRTILSVDEAEQSMTFAGDVPVGTTSQLMRANFDRLIDGASGAASDSVEPLGGHETEFALLISCVGRKLVLKERTEEEIEAVREIIGPKATMTGFYSYGELCPTAASKHQCQLHNQTMTITTFREE